AQAAAEADVEVQVDDSMRILVQDIPSSDAIPASPFPPQPQPQPQPRLQLQPTALDFPRPRTRPNIPPTNCTLSEYLLESAPSHLPTSLSSLRPFLFLKASPAPPDSPHQSQTLTDGNLPPTSSRLFGHPPSLPAPSRAPGPNFSLIASPLTQKGKPNSS
ncbi:hypothetical protein H0H92_002239, partial [Tricholoma furcatifolium]